MLDASLIVPPPLAVLIETRRSCNLRCKFCFFGQHDYDNGTEIATHTVVKILLDLRMMGYRGRVSLYNINEPLDDPRILDFLAVARTMLPECRHTLTTNGLLLTQPLLDRLTILLDRLEISAYGRIPDLDYSSPVVDIINKKNFFLGADSNRGGNLIGLPGARPLASPSHHPCANPLAQLVIVAPGIVHLCCADGFSTVVVGDIRETSVADVWWRSLSLNRARVLHATGRRAEIPICKACSIPEGAFIEFAQNQTLLRAIHAKIAATADASTATAIPATPR